MGLMESPEANVKAPAWPRRLTHRLGGLGRGVLDLLYPPTCLACDAATGSPDTICANCFNGLRPITAPFCPVLGLPFEVSLGPETRSAEALADPPPFARARAAVVYNDMAGTLVGRLKYGDRPELARFCARLMAGAGHDILGGDALLVPVPLHPARQRERRYNQSAELARMLGRLTGLPVAHDVVGRRRRTRQQVGLSGDGRQRNVQGAFAVHPQGLARAGGRRVVLVDDVYTTGATAKAVTRTLLRGGVESVDVLTFARVVIGADLPI